MANQTIYPYGTNGELPSSIGLVNDLVTGGVDKALTAEQGRAININNMVERDWSNIGAANLRIESDGKWNDGSNATYRHLLLEVSQGQRYMVTANSSYNCHYAFLTSTSCTAGASAYLVTGTSRTQLLAGESVDFEIPETCKFLYFYSGYTASSGSGRQALPSSVVCYNTYATTMGNLVDNYNKMDGKIGVDFSYNVLRYVDATNGTVKNGENRSITYYIDIHNYKNLIYSRPISTLSSPVWGMAFYDSSRVYISGQEAIANGENGYERTKIKVPEGAFYARFTRLDNSSYGDFYLYDADAINIKFPEIAEAFDNMDGTAEERTIHPLLTYDIIRNGNGEFSTHSDIANHTAIATPRFIKTSKKFYIKTDFACRLRVFYYGSDFSYLGYSSSDISLAANTNTLINLKYDCSYIKFMLMDSNGMTRANAELYGNFPDDWDTFNIRPSDNGYHRISVLVNVTHPTCCDDVTQSVQDTQELLPDYGVICLPTQYSNTGKPTRLIIYCHGSAVNYASDVTRFNSVDLDPTYWLAEGYAVMDIEGNPFDNTNEHSYIPQSIDSYVAAYKWAVEHYNIKKDGVFIGGRSMGGACTLNLIRREVSIPVIAACPNVPAKCSLPNAIAERKSFATQHMGFVLPTGFSWSNTFNQTEKQVFLDNWDKYIKCVPCYDMCLDIPSKEDIMDAEESASARRTLLGSLHAVAKCPVKFFGCNQDTTCPPEDTSELYYNMMKKTGQMVELRLFNSYKDYTGTGTSAHHYDTQDPALRTDITTTTGKQLSNVPIVYIEMLQFWRRYEQGI